MTRVVCWMVLFPLGLVASPAAAQKQSCTHPDTEETIVVKVPRLKRSARGLPKKMTRKFVHVLDLSEDVRTATQTLPGHLAQKKWCEAAFAVRDIEDALAGLRVDSEFVNEKFRRVERWARGAADVPDIGPEVEGLVASAAAAVSRGDHKKANKLLNRALNTMFRLKKPWDLPTELPEEKAEGEKARPARIYEEDIRRGCPALHQKGKGDATDLTRVVRALKRTMNDKKIRAGDVSEGPAIVRDMRNYARFQATWPAIRLACALLHHVNNREIDLNFVQGRLSRIGALRRERQLDESGDARFRELLRKATDAMGQRDFVTAHAPLEELLVMLGQPAEAGNTID